MTTIRRLTCDDLFNYNNVNLDFFTETARRRLCLFRGCKLLHASTHPIKSLLHSAL